MLSILDRNLIFVHGKGGVGKTTLSKAISYALADSGIKTLWVTLEDPTQPSGEIEQLGDDLWYLNTDFTLAFEEYAAMKIGMAPLTRLFLKNKLVRYLSKAAPGIHELVLLGKLWFERKNYDRVVVDLPSTGYGLAMFQSTENFSKLFQGGPLNRDAESMLSTFRDPKQTGHLIVSLPEEMPLRESLELNDFLKGIFPKNAAEFLVNRTFPVGPEITEVKEANALPSSDPGEWPSPVAESAVDYAVKRALLEKFNLRIWRDLDISFETIEFSPKSPLSIEKNEISPVVQDVVHQLQAQLKQGNRRHE